MRNKCLYVISVLGLLFATARGMEAACPANLLRPVVLPGANTAILMKSALGLSSGISHWTAPTHGVVTETFDRFIYTPNPSFWDLGVDSMVISSLGRNDLPKTVQWVLGSRTGVPSVEGFENPWNPNWDLNHFDPLAIGPLGKLSGNYGLHFTATSTGGEATVRLAILDTGGATAGGGATASWHPPGGGGGGSNGTCGGAGQTCPVGIWYRLLGADGDDDGMAEHSVYIREDGNLVLVGLSPGNSLSPGEIPFAVTSVSRAAHQLELLHWPEGETRAGGAGLWIDGRLALKIEMTTLSWRAPEAPETYSAFIWNGVPATGSNLAHSFDNLAVFETTGQARFDCLAVDGFDSGNLNPAWVPSNGGNLAVLSGAALAGVQGLDVQLADLGANVGGFLKLPVTGRNRHGLKFRFDPNSPEFQAGAAVNLAVGFHSAPAPRPFVATLNRNASGALVVQIHSNDDTGAPPKSTLVPISDAPHVLEIDWQRSPTTHVPSGYLRAWVDGVLVAEHLNVNNDAQSITEIRVGAFGLAGAAKGHVFLDQVEAWAEALPLVPAP